uniref:Uncharacterized protein n=1 Tax=Mycena chlorophos TaxID=658473 RepID=A0ABQ0MBB5_MYCCL|nr:predicted protein [Mycena chlorophos]
MAPLSRQDSSFDSLFDGPYSSQPNSEPDLEPVDTSAAAKPEAPEAPNTPRRSLPESKEEEDDPKTAVEEQDAGSESTFGILSQSSHVTASPDDLRSPTSSQAREEEKMKIPESERCSHEQVRAWLPLGSMFLADEGLEPTSSQAKPTVVDDDGKFEMDPEDDDPDADW